MPDHLHVVHPAPLYFSVIAEWMTELENVVSADATWVDWELHWIPMDATNNFKITDVYSRVVQRLGPVVIFDIAQQKPLEGLRAMLLSRSVVVLVSPADSTELWASICDAKQKHERGEPLLPRKFIAAILLVRKLYNGQYWGGTRDKNFLWSADLAKGRGVPDDFQDIIVEIANVLLIDGILIGKGNQNKKFALNPARRAEIDDIRLRTHFSKERLRHIFMKDRTLISARILEGKG